MGRLIVIEGLDGAGKQTLAGALTSELESRGLSVGRVAFPRYGEDVHADLVAEALRGAHGDLADSVYGMAVLYALDRQRSAAWLRAELADHDVLLLDRYVASNAAYGAARLWQHADGEFASWAYQLEVTRFGLPEPELQILLSVPSEVAAERAERRERSGAGDGRDRFESDAGLQERCAVVYRELAEMSWWSPWHVVEDAVTTDPSALADRVLA
ncbi:thymidylate kinase [Actinopolyspora erythraea]|uniref:Thymidylate kinase n=1 Tax=Actinopolyspora erythraea TaxID=414996 RepID=A0A099D2Y0_9ACTN|nr:dTMP kinase [Actinopolyspora erythraea]ASU77655.1 thymidylate kinase [Actinopolyspora erythraea]KGI80503.1 thymidylate kinase [Actinopolyspora erythraea]